MLTCGCSVPPEQSCGGGVAEGATQAVIKGGKATAEVATRSVHRLAERQIEARFVCDMPTIEFIGVTGRAVGEDTIGSSLSDEIVPGPAAPGIKAKPRQPPCRAAPRATVPRRDGRVRERA